MPPTPSVPAAAPTPQLEVADYPPPSRRQRLLTVAAAVLTAGGIAWLMLRPPTALPRVAPAEAPRCAPGQTGDCVGGRSQVIVMPTAPASTPR